NYILVMLFVKYISDVWQDHYDDYESRFGGDEEKIRRRLEREKFVLPAGSTFPALYAQRNATNLGEVIDVALEAVEDANVAKLRGVFRNISFNSDNLGNTRQRNERLKNLLNDFNDPRLDMRPSRIGNLDIIGNAYEYLIGKFAADAGKKAGEFYTPPEVSELLARLVDPQPGDRICDPACGSGSLLIKCAQRVGDGNYSIYGQESNGSTWALAKMNMFLHDISNARLEWGDTLNEPRLVAGDRLMTFEVVVANPPFSLDKWGAERAAADRYGRYWRGTPPRSKGDYAFISHMIATMDATRGRVGVVVPHGVLFRGGAEGKIREGLLKDDLIEAVVGLGPNLFYGTGIPAAVLFIHRDKPAARKGKVLIVNGDKDFVPGKNQNALSEENVAKLARAVHDFADKELHCHVVGLAEIRDNDFNLNLSRYVQTEAPPPSMALPGSPWLASLTQGPADGA
ncbi:MAG: SAM-dependent DNA methyltransferase, partial [Anaerolineales bacterium]|nr:SAM-dependent DNA methyltransferase [Anaerolineales bacterium]